MAADTLRPDEPTFGPSDPGGAGKPGAIIMARHGEPDISRRLKLCAAEYAAWWARYEETGLRQGQEPPERLLRAVEGAAALFASSRIRAIETARAVAAGRVFEVDETLIEAPLPPPLLPSWLRFSPRTWGVIARFWWFFNHHHGQETRPQAEVRAAAVAERLELEAGAGGDVVVLAHGYFNHMIGRSLKRRGWRLVEDHGFHYWSLRRFERV